MTPKVKDPAMKPHRRVYFLSANRIKRNQPTRRLAGTEPTDRRSAGTNASISKSCAVGEKDHFRRTDTWQQHNRLLKH
jgi:hypothetical protein